ncbi:MAG: hypothetical protein ABID54_10710 [Pseudomonadota bacterium]
MNDINQQRQNKPTLIARDFLTWFEIPEEETYRILLNRGVFKWLAVRRQLIKLKNAWKAEITLTIERIKLAKKSGDARTLFYLRGYLKALERQRGQIRALCHSPRVQAPDNDRKAKEYLRSPVMEGER